MRFALALSLAVLALAATAAAWAQTTRAAERPEVKVSVWTCPDHEQFRMRGKGECPVCEKALVKSRIVMKGRDVAGDPYPLRTCPVSNLELSKKGTPIVMMHEGREVRFCCSGCIKPFEADAAKYLAKIDEAIIKQQRADYPMTTCPVSQEALGSMGEPVDYVYNNRLVRFCCKGCVRQFTKAPGDYLGELDRAVVASQREHYPLSTCVISGEPLDAMGGPVDLVVANRLVRFCCSGCVDSFYKAPGEHLATLQKVSMRDRDQGHDHDHDRDHGHGHDHGHDHDHDH